MGLLIEIIKLTVNYQVGMNTVYGPKVYQSEYSCMISEICSHPLYISSTSYTLYVIDL